MERFANFLQLDRQIQLVLLVITALSAFTIFGLMITLPILGAWQVLSGIVGYYYLREKAHANYLLACTIVLGLMGLILLEILPDMGPFLILLFIIVPAIMAFFYYQLTKSTLARFVVEEPTLKTGTNEDLLDEELLWS